MLIYEYYDNVLQPNFGRESTQIHYLDTDSFLMSVYSRGNTKDLNNV